MPPVTLLIKPASSLCNLRCKYCFYHDVAAKRLAPSYGMMSEKTLEALVHNALDYADEACTFAFQGGEPTITGLGFYEKLLEFQKKYNVKRIEIRNAIQTNGTLIDEAWARFLGKNGFLVGLSVDGGKQLHDDMRTDAGANGTFERAMGAARLFDRYGVQYNILCVVTNAVARHGQQVYNFMKKSNFRYLQFIPCLNGLNEDKSPHSPTAQRYASFLKSTFDSYYNDFISGSYTSIRLFDNYISMLAGNGAECCGMSGVCALSPVVEGDGSVYPCDFYVLDRYKLGNIMENSLAKLLGSDTARLFLEESDHVDPKCTQCRWAPLCRGGCRRYREPFIEDRPGLNLFCESYRDFFDYAYSRMQPMAASIMAGRR